jgi:hypothetical protein
VLHRARRHAVQVATRVAIFFGIVQLGRHRPGFGGLGAAQRLAAVATVPLIIVSMNASSPPVSAASAAPQEVVSNAAAPAAVSAAGGTPSRAGVHDVQSLPLPPAGEGRGGGVTAQLPGSTATLHAATDAVGQLLRRLPAVAPVAGKPAALPSVAALPSPPPIP